MQKKMDRYKFLDVLIVLGSILFSLVTITVFCFPGQRFDDALDTILLFQIIMGNAVMAFSFGRRNRFYQFYTGVILFLWGVFTFIFNKWLPLTIYQWWPVYVELSAFALLGSGFYKYRKMKLGTKLIHLAIESAKKEGCYKIILDCNDSVKAFYEKVGFIQNNYSMQLYFK